MGRKVIVKDGNVEKALRKLKKKVSESGLLQELQARQTYTKPSVKRKIERAMAKKRWKKQLAQQNMFTHKK
ncbi:30S ribosomal protein S21 [bacterium]|nr:30S ribosomal protein S21 [Candidatus Elulimicrobium humile]